MTDLTPLGLRLSRYHAAGGWDAVAREVERSLPDWMPIETAPQTGERFIATCRILKAGTKEFLYWQTDIWRFDEGKFETDADNGIWFSDCELWCPVPEYPAPTEPRA